MRAVTVDGRELRLEQGDITTYDVDAIVNAANQTLLGGGGVDGAIHRAGGPAILEECRRIGGCPTGEARLTSGGNLPARYVIHAVGPIWRDGRSGEAEKLASAYRWSLRLAEENGLASVAFPSISTGAYGYPVEDAAPIALRTALEHLGTAGSVRTIVFVLFTKHTLESYERALDEVARSMGLSG